MTRLATGVLITLLVALAGIADGSRDIAGDILKLPSEAYRFFHNGGGGAKVNDDDDSVGTRWAVLLAGSNGFWNYRHQVCYLNFIF